jgi:hypothetical protein
VVTGNKDNLSREALWEALRRRVCSVCLDRGDDGTCGRGGEFRCALEEQLERVALALSACRGQPLEERARAVEEQVCRHCSGPDHGESCRLGERGECAVRAYLPLVARVVDDLELVPADSGAPREAGVSHSIEEIEEKPQ